MEITEKKNTTKQHMHLPCFASICIRM